MFIAQVAVDLPNQNAPVLVAHPLGNRHKVNASHYPLADEMVSAIPEGEVGDSCRIPCPIKCLLQASHRYVMVVFPRGREEISRVAPSSAHGSQVSLERRTKIHHAKFMVLGQSIRPDHELIHRPVRVAPLDPQPLKFSLCFRNRPCIQANTLIDTRVTRLLDDNPSVVLGTAFP